MSFPKVLRNPDTQQFVQARQSLACGNVGNSGHFKSLSTTESPQMASSRGAKFAAPLEGDVRQMRVRSTLLLSALLVAACKGADGAAGPQGPAGPPGPVGPAGPVNRVEVSGIVGASRTGTLTLPTAAFENNRLPAVSCYISDSRQTWLAVAQTPSSSTSAYCGLTGIGTATPTLTVINVPNGWYYYLIAIF